MNLLYLRNNDAYTAYYERYCTTCKNIWCWNCQKWVNAEKLWLYYNGIKAHAARKEWLFFKEIFPGRLISLFGDLSSSSCFPDLKYQTFSCGSVWSLKCTLLSSPHHPRIKVCIRKRTGTINAWLMEQVKGKKFRQLAQMSWRSSGRTNFQNVRLGWR